ncbi:MAG: M3 family metallopeptidase [Rhodobacteraceae bacterium]|nr:M3 family metallopeptidase [Paracoccaceae bacterium]
MKNQSKRAEDGILLQEWDTPYGLAPFSEIKDSDFLPALEAAIDAALRQIRRIGKCGEPATFKNVIHRLEQAGEVLERVYLTFSALASADSNPERQRLEREIAPRLAEFHTEIAANLDLFRRIESLWAERDQLKLGEEELMALKNCRQELLRSGARLEGAGKDRFRHIRARLAALETEFAQNVLKDEADWSMPITDADAAELPDFLLHSAAQAARDRGQEGRIVTLDRSLIVPFLQHCPNRELRRCAFEAWMRRGLGGGESDNRAIMAEILALRSELASLLGYASYADFKLENKMAGSPEQADALLSEVWKPALVQALSDSAVYQSELAADGVSGGIEAWDWRYYAERKRLSEHRLDESEIKQYLQLDQMREAAFNVAGRLFGLDFSEVECGLYHPDCRAWEVQRDGRHIALFIADDFARPSKRSGAWCTILRSQHRLAGNVRPVVVNVCNFMRPAADEPCLLSLEDARTLFHEFGHALHVMLSDITYPSLSGTGTVLDFVELPSQLFENWLMTPEVLDRFALHAETGESLPPVLRSRLQAARNFDQGFQTVEYIACAFVDLDLHRISTAPVDPLRCQSQTLARIGMPDSIRMRHEAPHFLHIFGGDGYASGYYSYLWSDVMAADAYASFLEAGGPFCGKMAAKLEQHILSKGGAAEPEELYLRFRGHLPRAEALIEKRGLHPAE